MLDTTNEKLKVIYDTIASYYVKNVVEIFNREFGEENVELKYPSEYHNGLFNLFKESLFKEDYGIISSNNLLCLNIHWCNEPYTIITRDNIDDLIDNIELGEVSELTHELPFYLLDITYNIFVRFPEVTIKNEKGQCTKVENLFIKVPINGYGKLERSTGFYMNKTHYTYAHFINNYLHSHTPAIDKSDLTFQECCKGDGPIRDTIRILVKEYDESQWMQFCWDLAKYVTIESEEGTPYKYLMRCRCPYIIENYVTPNDIDTTICKVVIDHRDIWYKFILYIIENKIIKFRWEEGQWKIGENPCDYTNTLSIEFLKFIRKYPDLFKFGTMQYVISHFFKKGIIEGDKIGYLKDTSIDLDEYRGRFMFTFKGEPQHLQIDYKETTYPSCMVLLQKYVMYITAVLLKVLNTKYGEDYKIEAQQQEIPFGNF